MSFAYEVRIGIDERPVFDAFLAWLRATHVPDVCRLGECRGEIVIVDGEVSVVVCSYRFASRDAFSSYERDHAPRLRAEAIAELDRLGVAFGRGATIARVTGEIVSPDHS